MKTLLYVPTTQSPGRPEQYISEAILQTLLQDQRIEVQKIPALKGANPAASGASFYDAESVNSQLTQTLENFACCFQVMRDLAAQGEPFHLDGVFFVDLGSPESLLFDYLWALEFPALPKPKIFGLFHSSTGIKADLFHQSNQQRHLEIGTLLAATEVYVASNYLKEELLANAVEIKGNPKTRFFLEEKIKVTCLPLPLDLPAVFPSLAGQFLDRTGKQKQIHFGWNHRLAEDKGWPLFLEFVEYFAAWAHEVLNAETVLHVHSSKPIARFSIALALEQQVPSYILDWIESPTREAYLKSLLPNCLYFSCAQLETFGYSMLEAAATGAVILVPDTAVYQELYDSNYFYSKETLELEPEKRNGVLRQTVLKHLALLDQREFLDRHLPPVLLDLTQQAILEASRTIVAALVAKLQE